MATTHVNVLPVINDWLNDSIMAAEEFIGPGKKPNRPDLYTFVKKHYGNTYTVDQRNLLVDCMIAAGIGNEAEQCQTVYCRCSYE